MRRGPSPHGYIRLLLIGLPATARGGRYAMWWRDARGSRERQNQIRSVEQIPPKPIEIARLLGWTREGKRSDAMNLTASACGAVDCYRRGARRLSLALPVRAADTRLRIHKLIPESGRVVILMSVFKAEGVRLQSLFPAPSQADCARPGAAARGDG
jgi:hypothetical protein